MLNRKKNTKLQHNEPHSLAWLKSSFIEKESSICKFQMEKKIMWASGKLYFTFCLNGNKS